MEAKQRHKTKKKWTRQNEIENEMVSVKTLFSLCRKVSVSVSFMVPLSPPYPPHKKEMKISFCLGLRISISVSQNLFFSAWKRAYSFSVRVFVCPHVCFSLSMSFSLSVSVSVSPCLPMLENTLFVPFRSEATMQLSHLIAFYCSFSLSYRPCRFLFDVAFAAADVATAEAVAATATWAAESVWI